jgi:uncharacterized damage-inducible protein DinB
VLQPIAGQWLRSHLLTILQNSQAASWLAFLAVSPAPNPLGNFTKQDRIWPLSVPYSGEDINCRTFFPLQRKGIFVSEEYTGLLPFYKGWDIYQERLVQAISPLSAAQLGLRTAPHLHSIGENVAHIIATRVGWFHSLMGEGNKTLKALETWDEQGAPALSTAELLDGLAATWQMVWDALARWTPANLDDIFEGTYNDRPYRLTRQWVIWHVIEHDLHHSGEVSFTLGTHQLAGVNI